MSFSTVRASDSSIAAEIAGLVAAADIARQNGDTASAETWESTADAWRGSLHGWTFTTDGFWDSQNYFIRGEVPSATNPNDVTTMCTAVNATDCYFEHDITDGGFLDQHRQRRHRRHHR